ncbi:MAG: DUF2442 domain-containing protein [Bacteroidetes bacterium]|nr:MAG: DUF2442 domain-containing protein [Bacteroidota bacterium]
MTQVISVKPNNNYQLSIELSNGRSGVFDVSPYIEKGIFKELKDSNYFSQVKILFGGVGWPHSQDFSGDTIDFELLENKSI